MFSCEFCEIFKNIYFYRTPLVAASGNTNLWLQLDDSKSKYFIVYNHTLFESHNLLQFFLQPFLVKGPLLFFFFSIRVFFHGHWRRTGQQGKGGDHLLFQSTTPTRLRTFRHIFATLHVRWLSHIFNCIAYQTATRWDLPPYRITIWLFDNVMLISIYLVDDLILELFYSNLRRKTGEHKLALTTNLVLQANGLTKCARHPNEIIKYLSHKSNTSKHFFITRMERGVKLLLFSCSFCFYFSRKVTVKTPKLL